MLKATSDNLWKSFLTSLILILGVGIGDEIIQWFLPNRSGETKDVFLNIFGEFMGISIGSLWLSKAQRSDKRILFPPLLRK